MEQLIKVEEMVYVMFVVQLKGVLSEVWAMVVVEIGQDMLWRSFRNKGLDS